MPDVTYVKRWLAELADDYAKEVKSVVTPTMNPVKPVKLEGPPTSKEEALSHLLWLCEQMRAAADDEQFTKSHEHMNFIRGALWYMGRSVP